MAALQNILRDDAVKARLKWFNVPKGFGFVEPEDGNYDAFLHVTTLKRAGVEKLGEGASLLCRIERGSDGARVTEIIEVLDAGESTEPLEQPPLPETSPDDYFYLTGTVKWYDPRKGFGFVLADDGLKDVFLHNNCLARCGLSMIEPGVSVQMNVRTTPKGREVVDIQFLHEQDYFSENDDGADDAAGNS
jgi:CspA family cold shock protein